MDQESKPVAPERAVPSTELPRRRVDDQLGIGRIISVSGTQATVLVDSDLGAGGGVQDVVRLGMLVTVKSGNRLVVAMVAGLRVPLPKSDPDKEMRVIDLELVGEIAPGLSGKSLGFRRGVSVFPTLNDRVCPISHDHLEVVYTPGSSSHFRVGRLHQDETITAYVDTDDLLSKHFAILGTTGSGKSCTVALILRAILKKHKNAHIVLLDPHNEYASSFAGDVELVTTATLDLPFWLFSFEEICAVLTTPDSEYHQVEIETLSELIPIAKQHYYKTNPTTGNGLVIRKQSDAKHFSVDTPVPYRIPDLFNLIDRAAGSLDKQRNIPAYRRLKQRIEALVADVRYRFMFNNLTVKDNLEAIISRLFRIPTNGKPISIIDLSGVPAEILNVVVSVLCRMSFDLALYSDKKMPILLVCEEAHRYVPAAADLGFEPTKRAIARIAKEGRKYGVSLCVVSQRPSELDPTILSQCNTIFSLRMSNEKDQDYIRAAVPDAAKGMLEFLPSLGTGEAIVFGEGVNMSMRIRFDLLEERLRPASHCASFADSWSRGDHEKIAVDDVVKCWRKQNDTEDNNDFNDLWEAALDPSSADAAAGGGDGEGPNSLRPEQMAALARMATAKPSLANDGLDAAPDEEAHGVVPAAALERASKERALDQPDQPEMPEVSEAPALDELHDQMAAALEQPGQEPPVDKDDQSESDLDRAVNNLRKVFHDG